MEIAPIRVPWHDKEMKDYNYSNIRSKFFFVSWGPGFQCILETLSLNIIKLIVVLLNNMEHLNFSEGFSNF